MQDLAVAVRSRTPPIARAFLRYVGRSRDPSVVPMLLLRSEVDDDIESMTARMFREVELDLERAVDEGELETVGVGDTVQFDYDTRLVLPALLTLGRLCLVANDVPLLRRVRAALAGFDEIGRMLEGVGGQADAVAPCVAPDLRPVEGAARGPVTAKHREEIGVIGDGVLRVAQAADDLVGIDFVMLPGQ